MTSNAREQEVSTESTETIDKQCRDIGEAKRKNNVIEGEATEKIAQLETALRRKSREVEEARYQSPPCSEWLVQGEKAHACNQEDLHRPNANFSCVHHEELRHGETSSRY